jgi:hypothetical protein
VTVKTSTLLRIHRALVRRKYQLLYGCKRVRRPGPKSPARELIDAVVEMKRRNPYFGCRKIAEQISSAFGIEINKDVVRRILTRYDRPGPHGGGPSWLTLIGHAKDCLWSVDLFRCESVLLKSYWVIVVMDVYTPVGSSASASRLPISTVSESAGCSIARSRASLYPGIFPRTTVRCFAFIAGERTFGYSTSMRLRRFLERHVRMLSLND